MEKLNKKKIKLRNNEELAYVEVGEGEKVIVLIHGNYSSSIHYYPLLTHCPKGYKMVAIDLRGFGDSTYLNRFNSLDELALDVIEALDLLNIKQFYLVGWSLGGGVSLKISAKIPLRVLKLVLIEGASYRGFPVYQKDGKYQNIVGKVYPSKEALALDPVLVVPALQAFKAQDKAFFNMIYMATMWNIKRPPEDEVDVYLEETMKERCLIDADYALAHFNMSNFSNLYNLGTNDINDVVAPTLVTFATKDLVVTEKMVMENLNAIKNAKLIKYEGMGHSLITDLREDLLKDLVKFFE